MVHHPLQWWPLKRATNVNISTNHLNGILHWKKTTKSLWDLAENFVKFWKICWIFISFFSTVNLEVISRMAHVKNRVLNAVLAFKNTKILHKHFISNESTRTNDYFFFEFLFQLSNHKQYFAIECDHWFYMKNVMLVLNFSFKNWSR